MDDNESAQKMKITCGAHQEFANPIGEDRYCIRVEDNIALFAVFDGHGGVMACDYACKVLLDTMMDNLLVVRREQLGQANAAATATENSQNSAPGGESHGEVGIRNVRLEPSLVNHIIVDAFVNCDNEILRRELEKMSETKRLRQPHVPSMPGSCAIVAAIIDGYLYVANLGDCRGTLCVGAPQPTVSEHGPDPESELPLTDEPASGSLSLSVDPSSTEDTASVSSHSSTYSIANTASDATAQTIERAFAFSLIDNGEECTVLGGTPREAGDNEAVAQVQRELAVPSASTRRKRKFSSASRGVGGEPSFIAVGSITADQCCSNAAECARISRSTADPDPIRPGSRDMLSRIKNPPLRIAGSLMTTRALGDCYLKHRDLTLQPLGQYVPYSGFICRPAVYFRKLLPSDKLVVLSSDGLWSFLSNEDVLKVASEMDLTPRVQQSPGDLSDVCVSHATRLARCSCECCGISSVDTGPESIIMSQMEVRLEVSRSAAGQPVTSDRNSPTARPRRAASTGTGSCNPTSGLLAERLVDLVYERANAAYVKTRPKLSLHQADLRSMKGKTKRCYVDDVTVLTLQFE